MVSGSHYGTEEYWLEVRGRLGETVKQFLAAGPPVMMVFMRALHEGKTWYVNSRAIVTP